MEIWWSQSPKTWSALILWPPPDIQFGLGLAKNDADFVSGLNFGYPISSKPRPRLFVNCDTHKAPSCRNPLRNSPRDAFWCIISWHIVSRILFHLIFNLHIYRPQWAISPTNCPFENRKSYNSLCFLQWLLKKFYYWQRPKTIYQKPYAIYQAIFSIITLLMSKLLVVVATLNCITSKV
jgi:hypothetical protein